MKNLIILLIIFSSCKGQNKIALKPDFNTAPPVLVYKTKADYNNLVPVFLSEDKSKIISYPHPADIKVGNDYSLSTLLNKGYLLDNRGIGLNVAFLKLTYEEYARLKTVPTLEELYGLIIDKDPLTELCNCGHKNAFSDPVKQINNLIKNNQLRTICKPLK